MVFSSVPVYLDPPNWQQQPNHHQTQHPVPPPLPMGRGGGSGSGGGGTGMIRPNSMTERARMAKIPQPEAALKCPRCESTNTKFCYFNNYSLSQPRHFCKTCRRYWTRGGALRNVPVGGGCRRNKRSSKGSSSSTRSKPHSVIDHEGQAAADHGARASSSSVLLPSSSRCTSDILGHLPNPQQQLLILPTLNHLNDYNFEAIHQAQGGAGFQVANNNGSNSWSILPSGLVDHQWKLQQGQQFPFLSTGLEQAPGLYSFESESVEPQSYNNLIGGLRSKPASLDAEASTQMENVKMEENDQRLNLSSRNFLGINSANDDQYWGSNNINNAWTNLSGFTSSSTTHIL